MSIALVKRMMIVALLSSSATPSQDCRAGEASVSDSRGLDCGTIALYKLLSLEGRPVPARTLQASLPPPSHKGYSLAELRDAARDRGLDLQGVKLPLTDFSLDRPALLYLQLEDHGHFLVVRPVGHSGKLVQILDSTGDPVVMDMVHLHASNQWTGMALVPIRSAWWRRTTYGLSIFAASGLALLLATSLSRPKSRPESGPANDRNQLTIRAL